MSWGFCQHCGITLARKDRADDPQPGRAGDVGNDVVELQIHRKRRMDDIGFPIDAGGFSGACGNIVCNKDCNICCKALRQFWREVCG
jgi:hypothetical protein